jgi:hypothetical protein
MKNCNAKSNLDNSNFSDQRTDQAEIARALNLYCPGRPFEIRIPNGRLASNGWSGVINGYFDDPHKAADAIAGLSSWDGVYFTLNEIDGALLSRRCNRLATFGKKDAATVDNNIKRRRWLPIDFDPVRPAGISSTEAEHDAALAHRDLIARYLSEKGWPEGIRADSGNGGHLIYAVDLPADDGELVKRVLEALAEKFNTDTVNIDTSVHNPARIWKLPGTLACKGDSTAERPHRMAKIISAPAAIVVVTEEQLEQIAARVQPKPKPSAPRKSNSGCNGNFDLDAWIREHEPDAGEPEPWNGGRRWKLKVCPFNSSHTDSAAVFQLASGASVFRCQHDSCKENKWAAYRELREPGYRNKRKPKRQVAAGGVLDPLGNDVELFHSGENAYATVAVGDHAETYPIDSQGFKNWLRHHLYESTGDAPNDQKVSDTVDQLSAQAMFDGPEHAVGVRLMPDANGGLFFDLSDGTGCVVHVTPTGWRVEHNPDARFVKRRGMKPLPEPTHGGSLNDLRPLLNAADDNTWVLSIAWLLGAMMPRGPYVVLGVTGEQGSAKSSHCKRLRQVIDPNEADLRAAPRDERDLAIAAHNSHVTAWDNVSFIRPDMSDSLCRLAYGVGFATRTLYTNDEETIISGAHPILLNGIPQDVVERPDLGERAISIHLPPMPEGKRKTEEDLDREFQRVWPGVLGALLDAVVAALGNLHGTSVPDLPRMADFARWVVAAEVVLPWAQGTFLAAYSQNRAAAERDAIEASPIGQYVVELVDQYKNSWVGTAKDLLLNMENRASDTEKRSPAWPKSARGMRAALDRIKPALRRAERIVVEQTSIGRGRDHRSGIVLRRLDGAEGASEQPPKVPPTHPNPPRPTPTNGVFKSESQFGAGVGCGVSGSLLLGNREKSKNTPAEKPERSKVGLRSTPSAPTPPVLISQGVTREGIPAPIPPNSAPASADRPAQPSAAAIAKAVKEGHNQVRPEAASYVRLIEDPAGRAQIMKDQVASIEGARLMADIMTAQTDRQLAKTQPTQRVSPSPLPPET